MQIEGATNAAAYSVAGGYQPASASFNAFGSVQFMQMLMAQLTHQNPMEPMNDSEMMSQFSQLNSLNELQSIRQTMDTLAATNQTGYAASLIGKNVKALKSDGTTLEGVVTGIVMENNQLMLQIGEEKACLADVLQISGVE